MRRRTGIGATPGADCAPRGASTFTWTVRTFFQASSKPVRGHVRAFRHRNEVFPRPVALELDRMRFDRVDVTHLRLVASVDCSGTRKTSFPRGHGLESRGFVCGVCACVRLCVCFCFFISNFIYSPPFSPWSNVRQGVLVE